ncbi:MAG: hypothetical protein BWK80_49035 [Desulfobacteraceae bacterium IS3]|nr:MAG: hypothetical protein BWK80_49035 [Desulfobacteraceae bacterium IS3]
MSHLLYKKFLKNKRVYILNSAYWKKIVNKIFRMSGSEYIEWLNTTYCNGKKFYNGNPIFNGLFKEKNKAVRIIQEEPENEDISISAWIDKIELEADTIYELVISLELSKESKAIAESLIKAWITDDLNNEEMENCINEKLDFLYPIEENYSVDIIEELKAA